MGLSASQARQISLAARQSNLEYQGQQINQERGILSQQTANLYNSLLSMDVPVPPSTKDYTRMEYSGTSGGTKYSFAASDITPGKDNTYNVVLNNILHGSTIERTANTVTTRIGVTEVKTRLIKGDGTTPITEADLGNYYINDGGNYRTLTLNDVQQTGTGYVLKQGVNYYHKDESGDVTIPVPTGRDGDITIAGHQAYTIDGAHSQNLIDDELYSAYCSAIENSGLMSSDGKRQLTKDDFLLYFDNDGKGHFVQKNDVKERGQAARYDFSATGQYTNKEKYEGAKLEFDAGTGRITSISVPNKSESGEIVSYTNITVEASEVTDEVAYQEACAKYEYQQFLYDKEQQEVNAKTEIIQKEDRDLELKLARLDNERKEITTEMDSVKKVIEDNVNASYKTFSG